jgi:peroxiredoxin
LATWLLSSAIIIIGTSAITARADTSGQQRAQDAGKVLLGKPAPALILKTIDGDTIDLSKLYQKKAVYLKFWATWCVPCRQQIPHLENTFEHAGPDLAVIAVNTGFNDSIEAVRTFRQALGIKMPIVIDDGRLAAAFHLRVTPQHIVIARDGRVTYVGHLADADLDQALISARNAVPLASSGRSAHDHSTQKAAPPAAQVDVGDRLPALSPATLDGQRVDLRHPEIPTRTVLVFLSPWCESYLATSRPTMSKSCRQMREQVTAAAKNSTARWIGIASGLWATEADLRDYAKNNEVDIPLALDSTGDIFRAFKVNEVPTVIVADARGRIVRRITAADSADRNAFALD